MSNHLHNRVTCKDLAVGPQNMCGSSGKEIMNLLTLPGMEPRFLGRPARDLVSILTTLPRVSGSTT